MLTLIPAKDYVRYSQELYPMNTVIAFTEEVAGSMMIFRGNFDENTAQYVANMEMPLEDGKYYVFYDTCNSVRYGKINSFTVISNPDAPYYVIPDDSYVVVKNGVVEESKILESQDNNFDDSAEYSRMVSESGAGIESTPAWVTSASEQEDYMNQLAERLNNSMVFEGRNPEMEEMFGYVAPPPSDYVYNVEAGSDSVIAMTEEERKQQLDRLFGCMPSTPLEYNYSSNGAGFESFNSAYFESLACYDSFAPVYRG